MNRHIGLTFLALAVCVPCEVFAGAVVLDFEDLPSGQIWRRNETSRGFRLSPSDHIDVGRYGGASQSIGFDTSLGGVVNPDFLGQVPAPGYASVYIDFFGQSFSLTSFLYHEYFGGAVGASVVSSEGGIIEMGRVGGVPTLFSLSGPGWANVKWIELRGNCAGIPCMQFDDMTLSVPTPGTFALVGIGALGLMLGRRRQSP